MGSERSVSIGPGAALWTTLRADRWVHAVLAAFGAAALLYLLPVLNEAQRVLLSRAVAPLIFLTLILAALISGLGRLSTEERRFWQDVIAAFGALLAVAVLYLLFPGTDRPLALELTVEVLYAAYYAALALAAERQPHRTYRWRPTGLERALAWPAVTAFILALLAYFVIVPILARAPAPDRWLSSFALYLALDVYLTARFLWLSYGTGSARWRTLYLVLGLTSGAVLLTDLLELAAYPPLRGGAAMPWGGALDVVYLVPFVLLVLARSRHFPFRDEPAASVADERPETHYTRPSGRTMIHALALPLLHFAGYRLGGFDAAHRPARELLVLLAILVLGSIAVVQHRMLERKARELWQDREAVEATLRRNEKDLRMMVERYHSDEKLRLSEEKLAKAFRVCPDPMMITTMGDGQIKEINDSFELTTGFLREDIVGKTVTELNIYSDPDQRQEILRTLELEGSVREHEAHFRSRSGELIIGLVSMEKLNIDGEPHLLSVTRDVTERKRIEEKLRTQALLLDKAQDAIAVLDLEDRVTYWNRSAEQLYGWSAAEALGRPATELFRGEPALEGSPIEDTGEWIGELRQINKDGQEIMVESWVTWVRDSEGNPHSKLIISSNPASKSAEAAPLPA